MGAYSRVQWLLGRRTAGSMLQKYVSAYKREGACDGCIYCKTWLGENQCADFQVIASLGCQACLRHCHKENSCFWPILQLFFVPFQCFVWGFQTDEAYSTCGRTKVLYASSFTASFLVFTFLLTKPRVLFALPVISLMWWFQLRSWDMLTPRYFALSTDSKNWPWRVYWDWSGCLDRVIWSTWHLLGLNSISQIRSHSCKVSRSAWRVFASSDEVIVK